MFIINLENCRLNIEVANKFYNVITSIFLYYYNYVARLKQFLVDTKSFQKTEIQKTI